MSLIELNLPIDGNRVPGDVRSFLREAGRRIERFQRASHIPGFVPCDFEATYNVLRAMADGNLAPGTLFCEWGSGFGVVACLAAMLDFDAFGIEIEAELVEAAQRLADDFELPVEFACGSFIPTDEPCFGTGDEFAWLTTDGVCAHAELGLDPNDLDIVFVYPWPDEERLVSALFDRRAAEGAVLVTYHGCEDFRLRRKAPGRSP